MNSILGPVSILCLCRANLQSWLWGLAESWCSSVFPSSSHILNVLLGQMARPQMHAVMKTHTHTDHTGSNVKAGHIFKKLIVQTVHIGRVNLPPIFCHCMEIMRSSRNNMLSSSSWWRTRCRFSSVCRRSQVAYRAIC